MKVYFTSDLHLGHRLASDKRGFSSIEEHDEAVMASLYDVDGKRTMLWVLGDVAMSRAALALMFPLKATKKLVRGNHDDLKGAEWMYRDLFTEIHGFLRYKNVWLSHVPIHPQEMYRCEANVHGHIHKNSESPELPFPYINVNWDYWQRPVSLEEIRNIIRDNKKSDDR